MPALLSVRTNMGSIRAQRQVSLNNREILKSSRQLSSGLRLNSAADDSARMAISTHLRAQLRGFQQATRNARDGVNILQTADGTYNEVTDVLSRMRELAVQAASGNYTDKERAYIQTEFADLQAEIDRIAAASEYNDIKLLDGSAGDASDGTLTFQVGTRATQDDRITVTLDPVDTGATSLNVAEGTTDVQNIDNARSAITKIDNAFDVMATKRAGIGSKINKLVAAVTNLGASIENVAHGNSQLQDVDMAEASTRLASAQVLREAGVAMLSKSSQELGGVALRLLGA